MGNSKSKKVQKEPDKFFERERWKEQRREEKRKKNANPANKRVAAKEAPLKPPAPETPPGPGPIPAPAQVRSYDSDALDRMRHQLNNDSDAFLLNNILLCVQFFENYEREAQYIKKNPLSERDHNINEAMVRRHKHVFFADRLQECVHDHVLYMRRDQPESLVSPRMFVIYDNVEASEPGDTSDYSAVLDAPFYKLRIEESKEIGYVRLKKLEILTNSQANESEVNNFVRRDSEDSIFTDSEKESVESDDSRYASKGEALLHKIKAKIDKSNKNDNFATSNNILLNPKTIDPMGRRFSGPVKQLKSQIAKSNISNIHTMRKINLQVAEENEFIEKDKKDFYDELQKPRKSILKLTKAYNIPQKDKLSTENTLSEDTETSGYRSNSSSRHNESSETESDYGYSTITESTTPKRIELSDEFNNSQNSGSLPDECWTQVEVRTVDNWSDEDDDENEDTASKLSVSRNLYETHHFLSSRRFMQNFVDNFIINLGSALGLSQETVKNAPSQGSTIYCNTTKNGFKIMYEVLPALIASWPNAANQWIIRERKIIQNPRTNCSYQWPTRYMVNKAVGFGCILVPIGFRPKRGMNPDQEMQWKITFPAAERYLESCLAHSHMRCYLFALSLHKTFMENETSKIGIDANHIKNHLFWECENNYARWPEDRLGETLRLFLKSFYVHFGQSRFPNYFVETCNDFKNIPKPTLLKLQRKLADILEAPVMHVLHALSKLKYTKNDFYPAFNTYRLYDILTCKNPLRIVNPNLPMVIPNNYQSSDSEDDSNFSIWDKAKAHDKHYQWKKERQRQIKERRKNQTFIKKQKAAGKQEKEINKNIILPARMDNERRRVVLEFFIPHFIAMARSSEKFEAIKQAVIYLEQAQRLCILLLEMPAGDSTANDYLYVIREKLADCQRKLVNQEGFKLPPRRESHSERALQPSRLRKLRPRYEQIASQDSPTDASGILPFTFVDVHVDSHSSRQDRTNIWLNNDSDGDEDSKL